MLHFHYPCVLPDGFTADEARQATANAIRFWLSEQGEPGSYSFTNRQAHPDWIRAKAGYEHVLTWADELLEHARNRDTIVHSISFNPTSLRLPKLLSSGDELHVLSLTEKQYEGFKKLAKKKITYAPFLNTKSRDGKVDIVLGTRQLGFANHILNKVGYRNIEAGSGARSEILNERDKEELGMSFDSPAGDSKKNDTPSRSGSSECRDSSQGRDDLRRSNRKPSVEKKLEENKRLLERDRGKQKERSRDKSPAKTRTKSTGKER